MVRALLDGAKTQTRRIINPQPDHAYTGKAVPMDYEEPSYWAFGSDKIAPRYFPGDRLWVKETSFHVEPHKNEPPFAAVKPIFIYRADYLYREPDRSIIVGHKWKPSIFCSRAASRITLEIVDFVAAKVAKGVPLYLALRLINPPVYTVQDWNTAVNKTPKLLARYEQRLAEWIDGLMDELHDCTLKTMPAKVWIAERRYPEHFSNKPQGTNVTVNVNTLVGIENDVLRRASVFVKRGERAVLEHRPKHIRDAKQLIDIPADVQPVSISPEKEKQGEKPS